MKRFQNGSDVFEFWSLHSSSSKSILDVLEKIHLILRKTTVQLNSTTTHRWLGGVVVTALDLRLEIAGSIAAAELLGATLDKLFTHIVQRL